MFTQKRFKKILLASGGIDSFVAYHYLGKPQTLFFNIEGKYTYKELEVVKKLFPKIIIDNSLKLGRIEMSDAHIPFRNLFFALFTAAKYSDIIYIVGIKDDKMTDKSEEIFKEFSQLLSKLEGRKIQVLSPFWKMTKQDILKWYLDKGFSKKKLEQTISCYSSENTNYCGKCASCFRKWIAFWSVGIRKDFYNKKLINSYKNRCLKDYYNKERNFLTLKVIREYEEKNSNRY